MTNPNRLTSQVVAIGKLTRVLNGNTTASQLLNQLLYWQGIHQGEFYITSDQLTEQVGISRKSQIKTRKVLKSLGLLSEQRKGAPAKLYFFVHVDAVAALLEPYIGECLEDLKSLYKITEKAPKSPCLSDVTTGSQLDITTGSQLDITTGSQLAVTTGSQQVFDSRVTTYKEEGIKKGIKEGSKNAHASTLAESQDPPQDPPLELPQKTPQDPPLESSEAKFDRLMRARANGKPPASSAEIGEWQIHLRQLISTNYYNYRQVKENYIRWYQDFGKAFVEMAWELSKQVAAERGVRRIFAFIDLFDDYSHQPELVKLLKQNTPPQDAKPAPQTYAQGDKVIFRNEVYTVDETDNHGVYLELRDEQGNLLNAIPSTRVYPLEQRF